MFHKRFFPFQYFSPDNFAKLFRPKSALYNKVLELTIDDIEYLSFPCPCIDENVDLHDSTNLITLFNVVIAKVRDIAMRRVLGEGKFPKGKT